MSPHKHHRARDDAGFTLLELLVSLTLLSMIIAATPALVRMAGRGVQIAGELTRSQTDVAALNALADKVSEARPVTIQQDDGSRIVQFSGTPDRLRFVAPGVVAGTGGLLVYELETSLSRAGRPVLVLSRRLDEQGAADAAAGDARMPLPAAHRIAFRYFGAAEEGAPSVWTDRWEAAASLPQLVEIRTVSAWAGSPQERKVIVPLRLYTAPPKRRSP